MDHDTDHLNDLLIRAGLRPTRQRRQLAGLLFGGTDRHVTAEVLKREAEREGIRVALATVYNTLHQFTEVGLLREIIVDSTRTWFDTNTAGHHHFFNTQSRKLTDIPEDRISVGVLPAAPEGTAIDHVDVVIRVTPKGQVRRPG